MAAPRTLPRPLLWTRGARLAMLGCNWRLPPIVLGTVPFIDGALPPRRLALRQDPTHSAAGGLTRPLTRSRTPLSWRRARLLRPCAVPPPLVLAERTAARCYLFLLTPAPRRSSWTPLRRPLAGAGAGFLRLPSGAVCGPRAGNCFQLLWLLPTAQLSWKRRALTCAGRPSPRWRRTSRRRSRAPTRARRSPSRTSSTRRPQRLGRGCPWP
mmetsp:Transcript_31441/g.100268  ORF Transcript_31441/g.100268 Transcript_31441/m.100268 type:complete len:211 (-) Transcript_31441:749-1381(-)